MKKLLYVLLLSVAGMFLATACNDIEEPVIATLEPARMVSSTPANGSIDLPEGNITFELTYNQNVFSPSVEHNRVTLEGATITSVSASLSKVTVQATGLEKGKNYKLVIPEGVIIGPTKVGAAEAVISFATVANPTIETTLCTPNALPVAQKVYDFLLENYGKKTLSATMANVNWNIGQAERVYTLTGKYPAMNCFDYIHLYASPSNWIDYSDISVVKDWWDAGGLVAAMWHWNVPTSDPQNADTGADEISYSFNSANNHFDAANATVEGTWENKVFTDDLAKVVTHLKLLQEAGIPVIWRPFHEAAGGWFWWGKDAGSFKKLWVAMFDTFQAQGLNNLIWVWTSESGDQTWYPGDSYVDIIGRDLYGKEATDAVAGYTALAEQYGSKMITLSECGAYMDNNASMAKLSAQWDAGARWLYFMPWYDGEGAAMQHADDAWWQDAMNQTYVITRENIPSMK